MHRLYCLNSLLTLQISQQYLACLKENANDAASCRKLSKLYLQCRMDRFVFSHTAATVSAGQNAGHIPDRIMVDRTGSPACLMF